MISFAVTAVLTVIASIAIYYFQNIAIFIIVVLLWVLVVREDLVYQKRLKIYRLMENKSYDV